MDFNIIQVILVAIVAFIAAIDQFNFLESLYQPIVTGPIVGAILGNLEIGLIIGGTYQLMAIGSMPVGGAQPPNVVIGGIMATVFAISAVNGGDASTVNAGAAVGLAIPFALLGQYAVTILFTAMSPLMSKSDKYAEEANPKGIVSIQYLAMGILGALFAVITIVGLLIGQSIGDQLQQIAVDFSWVMAGLDVAGGMMRFVGFAILMKIMLSNDLWGFYFAGFAAATIVAAVPGLGGPALLIIAFIGIAIALYDYQTNVKIKNITVGSGADSDGI